MQTAALETVARSQEVSSNTVHADARTAMTTARASCRFFHMSSFAVDDVAWPAITDSKAPDDDCIRQKGSTVVCMAAWALAEILVDISRNHASA